MYMRIASSLRLLKEIEDVEVRKQLEIKLNNIVKSKKKSKKKGGTVEWSPDTVHRKSKERNKTSTSNDGVRKVGRNKIVVEDDDDVDNESCFGVGMNANIMHDEWNGEADLGLLTRHCHEGELYLVAADEHRQRGGFGTVSFDELNELGFHDDDGSQRKSSKYVMSDVDERLLRRLKYRWMATSLTLQGESARVDWVAKFKPPDIGHDDNWLTLDGIIELIRHVLQISEYEVSDSEIERFFDIIDYEGYGFTSFYKFVGLLEADNVPSRPMRKIWKRRKNSKKKKKKRDQLEGMFEQPPWVPPVKLNENDRLLLM
jgi:hypothetical protein